MGNIAKNVDEQIDLLQSRGMIINDIEKAKEVLLDVGYYRLGFYWFPYEGTADISGWRGRVMNIV